MVIPKEKLVEELFDLEEDERAELAGLLIDSLDLEVEKGVKAAWLKNDSMDGGGRECREHILEIERRMESLDTGAVKTVPWEDVKERLYKK